MATRRPKVPRADALDGQSIGTKATPPKVSASTATSPKAGTRAPSAPQQSAKSGSAGSSPARPASQARSASSASGGRKPTADPAPSKGARGSSSRSSSTARDDAPVPAKAFSGRLLALAVVMIAITIMLTPTVKIFLEKRAEISDLQAQISSRQAEQADLTKQLSRWQDPNYVKQQARDRINMVMPGETDYWVFGGNDAAGTPGGRTGSGSSANPANLPWVDALWESIRRSATD
ncbi:septum formation initiator family protein [Arthrobacter sp. SIMBA_036]